MTPTRITDKLFVTGQTGSGHADEILRFVEDKGYHVQWGLDTHPRADHFSAAAYLKARTGAPTAIGEKVTKVQKLWKGFCNWPDFPADGRQWDKLFADGETFMIGSIPARVMLSPGHTLASITYVIARVTLTQPHGESKQHIVLSFPYPFGRDRLAE